MPEFYNTYTSEIRILTNEFWTALPAAKKSRWLPVVDANVPPSPPYLANLVVGQTQVDRTYVSDTAAISLAAENAAELTRRTDAEAVLAQLEANLNVDPNNLAQASTQLRHIKRILFYLLKRALRS